MSNSSRREGKKPRHDEEAAASPTPNGQRVFASFPPTVVGGPLVLPSIPPPPYYAAPPLPNASIPPTPYYQNHHHLNWPITGVLQHHITPHPLTAQFPQPPPQPYGGAPNQQPYAMAACQQPATHVSITNNYYNMNINAPITSNQNTANYLSHFNSPFSMSNQRSQSREVLSFPNHNESSLSIERLDDVDVGEGEQKQEVREGQPNLEVEDVDEEQKQQDGVGDEQKREEEEVEGEQDQQDNNLAAQEGQNQQGAVEGWACRACDYANENNTAICGFCGNTRGVISDAEVAAASRAIVDAEPRSSTPNAASDSDDEVQFVGSVPGSSSDPITLDDIMNPRYPGAPERERAHEQSHERERAQEQRSRRERAQQQNNGAQQRRGGVRAQEIRVTLRPGRERGEVYMSRPGRERAQSQRRGRGQQAVHQPREVYMSDICFICQDSMDRGVPLPGCGHVIHSGKCYDDTVTR